MSKQKTGCTPYNRTAFTTFSRLTHDQLPQFQARDKPIFYNEQVSGVPHQHRRKLTGRGPALAYYRQLYELGQVMRLTEIPGPGRAHH
ncbi:hypothetical protein B0H10DRAFT_2221209 [Mycena sp. CBHHK59/15]|nr:hypothetical protein B0H10DRAFT_2221209 [Mycena sp. CBHHK59/15]